MERCQKTNNTGVAPVVQGEFPKLQNITGGLCECYAVA
jgi:hypothetical protein